jgi:hypothetical protein
LIERPLNNIEKSWNSEMKLVKNNALEHIREIKLNDAMPCEVLAETVLMFRIPQGHQWNDETFYL